MPNGTYGGVRGRKTKVGRKLLRFPPTRFFKLGLSMPSRFYEYFRVGAYMSPWFFSSTRKVGGSMRLESMVETLPSVNLMIILL